MRSKLVILLVVLLIGCTVVMLNKKSHVTVSPDTEMKGTPRLGSPNVEVIVDGDTATIKIDTIK
jgi:hypothetical protein